MTDASRRGHPDVCGRLLFRQHVIPWGLRLEVKKEACAGVGVPFQTTTEWAAHLRRECQARAGGKGMGFIEAYEGGAPGLQAGREQRFHAASTRESHRRRFTPGWTRQAGREGRKQFRRHRPAPLLIAKPQGRARSCDRDAGWLQVSTRGGRHIVFSRPGATRQSLGLVPGAPDLSAAAVSECKTKAGRLNRG